MYILSKRSKAIFYNSSTFSFIDSLYFCFMISEFDIDYSRPIIESFKFNISCDCSMNNTCSTDYISCLIDSNLSISAYFLSNFIKIIFFQN